MKNLINLRAWLLRNAVVKIMNAADIENMKDFSPVRGFNDNIFFNNMISTMVYVFITKAIKIMNVSMGTFMEHLIEKLPFSVISDFLELSTLIHLDMSKFHNFVKLFSNMFCYYRPFILIWLLIDQHLNSMLIYSTFDHIHFLKLFGIYCSCTFILYF